MTSENVPAVVARYFSAIGEMDPDAWAACFAEQGTSYEPGSPTPLQGHAALRQFLAGVLGAFEKITMTQDHVFLFEGIDVFEINQEGKIQTMWGYWNPAAMMAELQG